MADDPNIQGDDTLDDDLFDFDELIEGADPVADELSTDLNALVSAQVDVAKTTAVEPPQRAPEPTPFAAPAASAPLRDALCAVRCL